VVRYNAEKVRQIRETKTEGRFTLKGLLLDFIDDSLHLTRKTFFHTAIMLTLRPGDSLRKVISGYRQYLYAALEYLFFIGSFITILNMKYHFYENSSEDFLKTWFVPENRKLIIAFFTYAEEYAALVNVVAIPVFSLVSYLFFFNKAYNLAELLIVNTYIAAQQLLFLLVLVPLIALLPKFKLTLLMPAYIVLVMLYHVWVYCQFFEGKLLFTGIKSFFAVVLATFLQFPFNFLVFYFGKPYLEIFD
jgi:hypothetical protein